MRIKLKGRRQSKDKDHGSLSSHPSETASASGSLVSTDQKSNKSMKSVRTKRSVGSKSHLPEEDETTWAESTTHVTLDGTSLVRFDLSKTQFYEGTARAALKAYVKEDPSTHFNYGDCWYMEHERKAFQAQAQEEARDLFVSSNDEDDDVTAATENEYKTILLAVWAACQAAPEDALMWEEQVDLSNEDDGDEASKSSSINAMDEYESILDPAIQMRFQKLLLAHPERVGLDTFLRTEHAGEMRGYLNGRAVDWSGDRLAKSCQSTSRPFRVWAVECARALSELCFC